MTRERERREGQAGRPRWGRERGGGEDGSDTYFLLTRERDRGERDRQAEWGRDREGGMGGREHHQKVRSRELTPWQGRVRQNRRRDGGDGPGDEWRDQCSSRQHLCSSPGNNPSHSKKRRTEPSVRWADTRVFGAYPSICSWVIGLRGRERGRSGLFFCEERKRFECKEREGTWALINGSSLESEAAWERAMVRRAKSWRDLSGDSGLKASCGLLELGDGSLLPNSERLKAGDDLLLLVNHSQSRFMASREFTDGLLLATDLETHLLRLHSQILGRVQVHLQVLAAILTSAWGRTPNRRLFVRTHHRLAPTHSGAVGGDLSRDKSLSTTVRTRHNSVRARWEVRVHLSFLRGLWASCMRARNLAVLTVSQVVCEEAGRKWWLWVDKRAERRGNREDGRRREQTVSPL
jgi:hypothetical protein